MQTFVSPIFNLQSDKFKFDMKLGSDIVIVPGKASNICNKFNFPLFYFIDWLL